ncbi:MAG: hypothetical protein OER86_12065, partial [Phycisphaerae bacterium]|nr:hypothetical protein [Phycisphaerae bacterium]
MMRFYRRISDYLAVALVTIAIWVYAEGRNVQSYSPAEDVPLSVELSSPTLVVTSQSTDRLKIQFKGALSEIDKLRRELPAGLVLRLDQTVPGEHTLVLSRALARAQPLDHLGVNVTSVEPSTLTIATDRLTRRSVELVFSPADVQLVPETL